MQRFSPAQNTPPHTHTQKIACYAARTIIKGGAEFLHGRRSSDISFTRVAHIFLIDLTSWWRYWCTQLICNGCVFNGLTYILFSACLHTALLVVLFHLGKNFFTFPKQGGNDWWKEATMSVDMKCKQHGWKRPKGTTTSLREVSFPTSRLGCDIPKAEAEAVWWRPPQPLL